MGDAVADTRKRGGGAPGDDAAFRAWWTEFLADWRRRYPDTAPPAEEAARVAFAQSDAARAATWRHGSERWERRVRRGDGFPRLA